MKIENKFKFLPHTADVKFQAFGKTIEEAFENSALALTNIITKDKIKPGNNKKIIIKIKAKDYESLLVNFLEEFLFLFETKGFLLSKINKIKITNNSFINKKTAKTNNNLRLSDNINNKNIKEGCSDGQCYKLICEAIGDILKNKNYEISNHVKAITYNDMFVKPQNSKNFGAPKTKRFSRKQKNKFITQVVVDV